VNDKEYFSARNKANPYEFFGSHFFMNRNSLKMAQLDSFFHFIPTEEEFSNAMFYYADISGGPGGFSEYILWRRKQWILGFGITETGTV
jgi:hypothetical protein